MGVKRKAQARTTTNKPPSNPTISKPPINLGVRVVLGSPPHAPHKVNVEHFQAIHNVSALLDVDVLEAAIVASQDELDARCDDGPDGAVEHVPLGGWVAGVGHVNTMWSIPASQLHLRHGVGRILPVPMCQISDAAFVMGNQNTTLATKEQVH